MKNFIMLLVISALSGCAKQTFTMKEESVAGKAESQTHHFILSGIGQEKTINAAKVCGDEKKVLATETRVSFWNGVLRTVTWGIYTPQEASVYCEA